MITRRQALSWAAGVAVIRRSAAAAADRRVQILRVPANGLQPQAVVDQSGVLHLLYYSGDPLHGDLFYVRSKDAGATFPAALRVNSQAGSAIATGTIRGGQLAIGKSGRAHVAWNGSGKAEPRGPINPDSRKPGGPMLYSRLNDKGDAFEPQRNLMLHSFGLDGGGSIAAGRDGTVIAGWHGIGEAEANSTGLEGEARRRVWISRSTDDGRTFAAETRAWPAETGACGCCGMKLFMDSKGGVEALYRSATKSVHRDIYLLNSRDQGRSFDGNLLHKWEINACPMSSMDFAEGGGAVVAAWETGGQVYWTSVNGSGSRIIVPAPGEAKGRKHPRIAVNQLGQVLLAWTEGTGWQKGGNMAWQLFDSSGRAEGEKRELPGIPAWSFPAVAARPDNSFVLLY